METNVPEPEEKSESPQSIPVSESKESGSVQFVYRVGSQTQDKSRRLIQRQLILLLHAHNCQKKDRAFAAANPAHGPNAPVRPKCPIQQCKNMKDVWEHMRKCSVGPDCKFLHCASSLKILAHWKYCTTWECPVCHLIRLKGAQQVGASLTMKAAETARALAPKQLHSGQQIPPPAEQMSFSSTNFFPSQMSPQITNNNDVKQESAEVGNEQFNYMEQDQNTAEEYYGDLSQEDDGIGLRGNSHNYDYSNRNNYLSVPTADEVRRAYEQLGIPCPKEALSRLMATLPGGQNFEENVGGEKEDLNECSDSGFVPDEVPSIGAVADDVVSVQADEAHAESQLWRQSMSSLARERLVRQIHEAICVTTDDLRMRGEKDPRLINSVAFANRIELEAHDFAHSRAHYYELISNKVNTICQEIAKDFCLEDQSDEEEHHLQPVEHYEQMSQEEEPTLMIVESPSPIERVTTSKYIEGTPQNMKQLLEGFPCAFRNEGEDNLPDINLINLIKSGCRPRHNPQSPIILQNKKSYQFNYISGCRADCQGGPDCPFSLV